MKTLNKLCALAMLIGIVAIPASAQNKAKTVKTAITPTAVDMGLSVKWSNIELGAMSKTSAGKLYSKDEDVTSKLGEGWRLPTKPEMQELFDNCEFEIKLTQAGTPSHLELTSKKNSAKINIYIPKIATETDGEVTNNPIKTAQGNLYMFALTCQNNEGCICIIAKFPDEMQYQLKAELAKVGVKSMNPQDWPDEAKNELKIQFGKACGDGAFFDNKFSHAGQFNFPKAFTETKAYIVPVFKLDDDE